MHTRAWFVAILIAAAAVVNCHGIAVANTIMPDRAQAASLAATFSEADVREVLNGYYQSVNPPAAKIIMRETPANEMPADEPYAHFEGVDGSGTAQIWMNSTAMKTAVSAAQQQEAGDEFTSAMITAAVLQGKAGKHWQDVFQSGAGARVYGRAIVIAFNEQSAVRARASRADIALVHASIRAGMTRAQVYDTLRSRKLVAESVTAIVAYQPLPGSGCEATADYALRYWPQPNAHLPAACAHPAVFVDYTLSSNFACSTEMTQRFLFDERDRLVSMIDDKQQTSCL